MFKTAMWGVTELVVGAVGIVVYAIFGILIVFSIIAVLEAIK